MTVALMEVLQNQEVTTLILDLNRFSQLFQGIDATGEELDEIGGSYSFSTIRRKLSKGQPFDRVTLFDSGDFYKTFSVDVDSVGLEITANTVKNGFDLQMRWGFELVGLTDESRTELVEAIKEKVALWTLEFILN